MDHEKYTKLRYTLMESTQWPSMYMFKFIIPNTEEKLNEIKALFSEDTEYTFKTSRDIKFIGVTVKKLMNTADDVIDVYMNAQKIQGVVTL